MFSYTSDTSYTQDVFLALIAEAEKEAGIK